MYSPTDRPAAFAPARVSCIDRYSSYSLFLFVDVISACTIPSMGLSVLRIILATVRRMVKRIKVCGDFGINARTRRQPGSIFEIADRVAFSQFAAQRNVIKLATGYFTTAFRPVGGLVWPR